MFDGFIYQSRALIEPSKLSPSEPSKPTKPPITPVKPPWRVSNSRASIGLGIGLELGPFLAAGEPPIGHQRAGLQPRIFEITNLNALFFNHLH